MVQPYLDVQQQKRFCDITIVLSKHGTTWLLFDGPQQLGFVVHNIAVFTSSRKLAQVFYTYNMQNFPNL